MRTKTPELDQRILDAAARLFAGNHFHLVRMEDIAAEADVGKGTLYRYFQDKEELYLALLSRAAGQIRERLQSVDESEEGPVDRLIELVELILDFFDEQPHIFELIQQVEASRGTNHPWQAAREMFIVAVRNIFSDAKRSGAFTVREPQITSLMLLGGIRAIIRFGQKPRGRGLARTIVETVLNGAVVGELTISR